MLVSLWIPALDLIVSSYVTFSFSSTFLIPWIFPARFLPLCSVDSSITAVECCQMHLPSRSCKWDGMKGNNIRRHSLGGSIDSIQRGSLLRCINACSRIAVVGPLSNKHCPSCLLRNRGGAVRETRSDVTRIDSFQHPQSLVLFQPVSLTSWSELFSASLH